MPTIFIDEDGSTEGIASSLTQLLRMSQRRRASHIEPVNPILRWVFHFIRRRVSDESRLACWTRRWRCQWQARIVGGPVLGPFHRRHNAVAAEVFWINAWLEQERKSKNV